jgi:hypothetical protein
LYRVGQITISVKFQQLRACGTGFRPNLSVGARFLEKTDFPERPESV